MAGTLVGGLILQPVLAATDDLFRSTMVGAQQIVYGAILMLRILVMPRGIAKLVAGMPKRGWTGSRSAAPGTGNAETMQKVGGRRVPAGKESRR